MIKRRFMETGPKPREEDANEGKKNVTIHNYWIRHTQKASGEVFNIAKTGISTSNISEGGARRAEERGKGFVASASGAKGYKSTSARTQETFDALMRGYTQSNPNAPIKEAVRVRQELVASSGTPEFLAEYDRKWSTNKKRLLAEGVATGKYPDVEFSKLTPDHQEEIAEAAEEPVIREWIDDPSSTMATAFPPRIQAANFAVLFNRRHERMAEKLHEGSAVDLFHNTHKTATEPFLASGVLIRKSDGKRITTLEDIGGSLQILDQWESISRTDEHGKPTTVVKIRDMEFTVDPLVYKQLVAEGQKLQQEKRKR